MITKTKQGRDDDYIAEGRKEGGGGDDDDDVGRKR
mgnify:CR=1 FL=1